MENRKASFWTQSSDWRKEESLESKDSSERIPEKMSFDVAF